MKQDDNIMNVRLTPKQKSVRIKNAQDVAFIMRQILLRDNKIGREREHLWVVGFDSQSYIQYVELVSIGTKNDAPADTVEIFRWAVQKGVSSILVCHNHPSKNINPSEEDISLADRLIQAGIFLCVPVADFMIITAKSKDFYSFAKTGKLKELQKESYWMPPTERLEIERIRGKKEALMSIIAEMKAKGVPPETIAFAAGVSTKELKKMEKELLGYEISGSKKIFRRLNKKRVGSKNADYEG